MTDTAGPCESGPFRTRPLHPGFGVEVLGADLRRVTATEGYPQLRDLFEEHSVLLLRGQHLDDAGHLRVAALFGPIEDRAMGAKGPAPRLDNVTNLDDEGRVLAADDLRLLDLTGNQLWHTDSTFLPVPALANLLAARVLSSRGGETELVSTRTAWRDLPDDLRRRIEGRAVRHRLAHSRAAISEELARRHRDRWPDQVWRSTWTNPVNGRPALYLASHACGIEGMADAEGRALLAELIGFCTTPERTYTHRWAPGDVLIWDERATLHRGRPWPYEEERTLASVCVSVTDADGLADVRVTTGPVEKLSATLP